MPTPASPCPEPAVRCRTHARLTEPPQDLVTWKTVVALLKYSPHPIPESTLRRWYKQDPGRLTWLVGDDDRTEYVSLRDALEFHRDLVRGWLLHKPKVRRRP
jgi:hypothetical protein